MKATFKRVIGDVTIETVFELDFSVSAEKELAEKMVDVATFGCRPFAIKCSGFPEEFDEDYVSKLAASTKAVNCYDDGQGAPRN